MLQLINRLAWWVWKATLRGDCGQCYGCGEWGECEYGADAEAGYG